MMQPLFLEEIDERGVARITFTRAEMHNAFNDDFILGLTRTLKGLETDERVRLLVIAAQGKSFSAGADLNWMKAMAGYGYEENRRDAEALAELMWTLGHFSKPSLALVQGPAYGGGVGLVACCDIAVAVESVSFRLSEVKLGLIPAVISPYVIEAIGERAARRFFLTAEPFSAWEAHRLGLVQEVVPSQQALDLAGLKLVDALLAAGPAAQAAAKQLVAAVGKRPHDEALAKETARRIAEIRVSPEAREGLAAFLEKRPPAWLRD